MKPISVLFYIEPVCYRQDPLLHLNWVEWIVRIIRSQPSEARIQFAFASSPYLCQAYEQLMGEFPRCQYPVQTRDLLAPFGFDRHSYGRDLYGSAQEEEINIPLANFFRKVGENFNPDIVISFTQNRYIEKIFAKQRTLFWEVGPLPRYGGALTLFMDPRGHQRTNLLNSETKRILNLPLAQKFFDAAQVCWEQLVMFPIWTNPSSGNAGQWMKEVGQGRPIALLAMQPSDGLTVEGSYEVLAPEAIIMRWMQDLPPTWIATATYHTGQKLPLSVESMLAKEFPAFQILPEDLSVLGSEIMLPHIHGVSTVSSSVGMSALLHGKTVVGYGRSWLNGLSGQSLSQITASPSLTQRERTSLFLFLTNTYCHPLETCLSTPGYVANILRRLMEASDPVELYFDFSEWSPERVKKLLIAEPAS